MFTRRLPQQTVTATAMFVGSTAGGVLLAPINSSRAELRLQAATADFNVWPFGSVSASAGLWVGSGQTYLSEVHLGAVYGEPFSGNGATAVIKIWESSFCHADVSPHRRR
jgi:hypothetical protein